MVSRLEPDWKLGVVLCPCGALSLCPMASAPPQESCLPQFTSL